MYRDIFYNFYDEDEYTDIIKNVLKLFRGSKDYNHWLHSYNRNACVATGLTKDRDGVEIELHHYERTLWDWVEYIIEQFVQNELPLNVFYICLILSDLHLNHCIPCVTLSHDVHKMIHNDYIETINNYPTILENLNEGNFMLLENILEYHIEKLKKLFKEEATSGK